MLAQQGHRGVDRGPDLRHPVLHPVADAGTSRPGNSRASVAISIAASAGLRSGTGSSPTPTRNRSVQASAAAAAVEPALEEAVLPQPQLVEPASSAGLDHGPELLGWRLRTEDDAQRGRH